MIDEQTSSAGYEHLLTYKLSVVIYDLTVQFTERYINPRSRTKDQMDQAARSGKQNIVEGSKEESLKSYIKLLGVARASHAELLEDYRDYARQNGVKVWPKERAKEMREIREIWGILKRDLPYRPNHPYPLPKDRERAVNLLITLVNQTNYLLDKQIRALKEKFINEGGWTEKLFKRRLQKRGGET